MLFWDLSIGSQDSSFFKYELVDEDDLTVHTWDSNIVDHLMGQLLALKWSGIRFHSMKKIPLMKKEKIQLL